MGLFLCIKTTCVPALSLVPTTETTGVRGKAGRIQLPSTYLDLLIAKGKMQLGPGSVQTPLLYWRQLCAFEKGMHTLTNQAYAAF